MRIHIFALVAMIAASGACFSKPNRVTSGDGGSDDGGVDAACVPFSGADAGTDDAAPTQLAFAKIAAGGRHVCAIDAATKLWCWGENFHGELGERTDAPGSATGVPGLASPDPGWTEIAPGTHHTCGIRNDKLYCWGSNENRQSNPATASPGGDIGITEVTLPGSAPKRVFVGDSMSCAIDIAARLYCWGRLDFGRTSMTSPPTRLTTTGTFLSVSIADDHACAIEDTAGSMAGQAVCWGSNNQQQLGVASSTPALDFTAPARQPGALSFASISSAHEVSCGVTDGRKLVCWGSSNYGHLLDNSFSGGNPSFPVDSGRNWDEVSVGPDHVCGRAGLEIYCYGDNKDGAVGAGVFNGRRTVGSKVTLADSSRIVAGEGFSCSRGVDGLVSCWGANTHGQLGNLEIATKDAPTQARIPMGNCELVRQVVAGDDHACALVGDATGPTRTYCWGRNQEHQVDSTSAITRPIPAAPTATPLAQLSAGGLHNCGRTDDGAKVVCWGDNSQKQLGRANSSTMPNEITSADLPETTTPWISVVAGSTTSCGIVGGGELYCWGSIPGASPIPTAPPSHIPKPHNGGWQWAALSLGSGFALGTAVDPAAPAQPHVIGFGAPCALGNSSVPDVTPDFPSEIMTGVPFAHVQLAAAQSQGGHGCLQYDRDDMPGVHRIACFGANTSGQTGEPSAAGCLAAADRAAPTMGWGVTTPGVGTIATASQHSCALDGNHKLFCWGGNHNHELGDALTNDVPRQINSKLWSEIATGSTHTCGIDDQRKHVYCWGLNKYGQLGDGSQFRATPVPAGLAP